MKNTNSNKIERVSEANESESNNFDDNKINRGLNMKKLILAAAIVFATVEMSFAQSSANTTVNLTATVIQGLTMSVTGSLAFGTIVAGTTPASLSAQTNGGAPLVTVTGNGHSTITVTFGTTTLTGPVQR